MTDSNAVHEPLGTDVRNLLRIAVPISLGSLVQFLVVLTDNFFLSRAGERKSTVQAMRDSCI